MQDEQRIPTQIWVDAGMRAMSAAGVAAYVVRKGDLADGLVLLKISDLAGQCRLLTKQRDAKGALVWTDVLGEDSVPEKTADEYIARAVQRDPDQWVIEVEDRALRNFFDER